MKKTTYLLQFLILLLSTSIMQAQTLCTVTGTGEYNVKGLVTTGGETNISLSSAAVGTNNYANISQSVKIAQEATFNVSVTQGNTWSRVLIWIDWNGDKDFADAGEYIGAVGAYDDSNPLDLATDITVPASTSLGTKTMRIVSGDSWTYDDNIHDNDDVLIPSTPCGEIVNSAIKDFGLEVTAKLGVDDFENNLNLAVFPNPIEGNTVNLRMNVQNQKLKAELYNLVGKKVHSLEYKSFNVQEAFQLPPHLTKGLYVLKVTLDNKTYTHKIIK